MLLDEAKNEIITLVKDNPGILLANLITMIKAGADDVFRLIVREELYFELEQELLCEPEFCHIFISPEVALAHQEIFNNRKEALLSNNAVNIIQGECVLWDKNPWELSNVTEEYISMKCVDTKGFTVLKREQFIRLISEGHIKDANDSKIALVTRKLNDAIASATPQELAMANYKLSVIKPYLDGKKLRHEDSLEVNIRTIRNWVDSYILAKQVYGNGYYGLLPRTRFRGNRKPKLPKETASSMIEFIKENETPTDESIQVLYGAFLNYCEDNTLIPPSAKTFYKAIKSRPIEERLRNTKGARVAYQYREFAEIGDMTPSRHGDRAFELAHLDHTLVDLETVHSKTGEKHGKFWLTILFDAFSRRVLAFYISYDNPSKATDMMILRECVRRFNRLPQNIITDNGSDFTGIYFQTMAACYGVVHKRRKAHEASDGAPGERYFGVTTTQIVNNLCGNTKAMKNVRQVTKSVNPENLAVWTLPLLYELFDKYFYEFYDNATHSALGESPRKAFERSIDYTGKRDFMFIPFDADFLMMTMPFGGGKDGTAKVDASRGFKIKNFYYYSHELRRFGGQRVPVRYDPWDVGVAYCYVNSHWVKCYNKYYAIFKGRSMKEIQIATAELQKEKKDFSKNRSNFAKELAKFLIGPKQTEEILKQRAYDEEMEPQLKVINGGLTGSTEAQQVNSNQNFGMAEADSDVDFEAISKTFVISEDNLGSKRG